MQAQSSPTLQIPLRSNDLHVLVRVASIGFGIWLSFVTILAAFFPDYLFVPASKALFTDFAETLAMVLMDNPYEQVGMIYPPIAFLLLYPFALLCRGHIMDFLAGEMTLDALAAQTDLILSYLLYFTIHIILILWLILRFSGIAGRLRVVLAGFVLTFGPMLFCFLRGNNTLTVCLMVTAFFCLEQQEKLWMRELGYAALALAISMKIYPIFLCLYLLWRYQGLSRVWVLARTALYTLLLVFLPFFLYATNPLPLIWNLVQGALYFSTGTSASIWPTNVSIDTLTHYICCLFSLLFEERDMDLLRTILSYILRIPALAIAGILSLITPYTPKLRRDFVTLACAAYLLLPAVSNGYCLTIMLVPFAYTLLAWQTFTTRQRKLYLVCYSLILCGGLYTFGLYIGASIATMILAVDALRTIARSRCLPNPSSSTI